MSFISWMSFISCSRTVNEIKEKMNRWVPFNPNTLNPNSQFIRKKKKPRSLCSYLTLNLQFVWIEWILLGVFFRIKREVPVRIALLPKMEMPPLRHWLSVYFSVCKCVCVRVCVCVCHSSERGHSARDIWVWQEIHFCTEENTKTLLKCFGASLFSSWIFFLFYANAGEKSFPSCWQKEPKNGAPIFSITRVWRTSPAEVDDWKDSPGV